MSEWNDIFGVGEKKIPPKKNQSLPSTGTKKRVNPYQRSMIPERNMITQADLKTLKNELLKSISDFILKGLESHVFSRSNLIKFIGQRGSRGTKLCELRDMFYPTPLSEIDALVQQLRGEGIIKRNRNGWMSLSFTKVKNHSRK